MATTLVPETKPLPALSHEEILRYSRHLILPELGTELIDYEQFCGIGAEPAATGPQVSAPELAHEIHNGSEVVILDVREPHELDICRIDGAIPIPLGELPSRLSVLDGHRNVVTLCHKGVRSLKALEILRSAGFARVRSLHGGIDAWARAIDPTIARY